VVACEVHLGGIFAKTQKALRFDALIENQPGSRVTPKSGCGDVASLVRALILVLMWHWCDR
jgi:hypothetical protein